jgi:hypothetical protein
MKVPSMVKVDVMSVSETSDFEMALRSVYLVTASQRSAIVAANMATNIWL